jgi:hypothetical protein
LSNQTPHAHAAHVFTGLLQLACTQAFGLLWNILYGLQKIAESPAFLKQQAGRDAERYVRQLITDRQRHFPHSLALHGTARCLSSKPTHRTSSRWKPIIC